MADESMRPDDHPAPPPADADAFERELMAAWRADASSSADTQAAGEMAFDGPSEWADARIRKIAHAAVADDPKPSLSTTPAWLRWSAAASMALSVALGLMLWSARVTELDVPEAVMAEQAKGLEAELLRAPVVLAEPAFAPAAVPPPPDPGQASRRVQLEEVVVTASRVYDAAADGTEAEIESAYADDAIEEIVAFVLPPERHDETAELYGTLVRIDESWWLDAGGVRYELDLDDFEAIEIEGLRPGMEASVLFRPEGGKVSVDAIEAWPADAP